MSSWNNRYKNFSESKALKIHDLIKVIGEDAWEEFNDEVYEKFNGRIEHVYSDCIRGVIDLGTWKDPIYISEKQFKEDCKEINKMLNKLLKTSLQNK